MMLVDVVLVVVVVVVLVVEVVAFKSWPHSSATCSARYDLRPKKSGTAAQGGRRHVGRPLETRRPSLTDDESRLCPLFVASLAPADDL